MWTISWLAEDWWELKSLVSCWLVNTSVLRELVASIFMVWAVKQFRYISEDLSLRFQLSVLICLAGLTLILLTWTIWWAPNNASRWQMGFNSAFKGLMLYRPGRALKFPGGRGSQISRQSARESGKVVSPNHRPPLPPGNIPGTHFCKGLSHPRAIVRLEGLCQWKISPTPSGIEPATFRLAAQCLSHLHHRTVIRN